MLVMRDPETGHAFLPPSLFTVRQNNPLMERVVLGFDFGTRRIGVSIGNTLTHDARALMTINGSVNDKRWHAIDEVIGEWQPHALVVGIPRHPDGTPHVMTERCERFARQLEGRYRLPVARVDERYSSAVVEDTSDVDAEAAAVILRQWIAENSDA